MSDFIQINIEGARNSDGTFVAPEELVQWVDPNTNQILWLTQEEITKRESQ